MPWSVSLASEDCDRESLPSKNCVPSRKTWATAVAASLPRLFKTTSSARGVSWESTKPASTSMSPRSKRKSSSLADSPQDFSVSDDSAESVSSFASSRPSPACSLVSFQFAPATTHPPNMAKIEPASFANLSVARSVNTLSSKHFANALYVLAVANKLKRVPCPSPSRTAAVSRSPSRSFSNESRISRRRNAKYALTFHRFKYSGKTSDSRNEVNAVFVLSRDSRKSSPARACLKFARNASGTPGVYALGTATAIALSTSNKTHSDNKENLRCEFVDPSSRPLPLVTESSTSIEPTAALKHFSRSVPKSVELLPSPAPAIAPRTAGATRSFRISSSAVVTPSTPSSQNASKHRVIAIASRVAQAFFKADFVNSQTCFVAASTRGLSCRMNGVVPPLR
mmetsp:Transcript_282/g.1068  ORF Transcript_282/g.1068 Transcript_282/m.1068 type:complete len:397 (+) Transcript_282:1761-2951(+)